LELVIQFGGERMSDFEKRIKELEKWRDDHITGALFDVGNVTENHKAIKDLEEKVEQLQEWKENHRKFAFEDLKQKVGKLEKQIKLIDDLCDISAVPKEIEKINERLDSIEEDSEVCKNHKPHKLLSQENAAYCPNCKKTEQIEPSTPEPETPNYITAALVNVNKLQNKLFNAEDLNGVLQTSLDQCELRRSQNEKEIERLKNELKEHENYIAGEKALEFAKKGIKLRDKITDDKEFKHIHSYDVGSIINILTEGKSDEEPSTPELENLPKQYWTNGELRKEIERLKSQLLAIQPMQSREAQSYRAEKIKLQKIIEQTLEEITSILATQRKTDVEMYPEKTFTLEDSNIIMPITDYTEIFDRLRHILTEGKSDESTDT
jgi:hypothetical protein